MCYLLFFKYKKPEENASSKQWSPPCGESLGTTPIFLTTPTSPSACNHASYHRVEIETLPFCCPRLSPFPPVFPVRFLLSRLVRRKTTSSCLVDIFKAGDVSKPSAALPPALPPTSARRLPSAFISPVHTRHALSLFRGVIVFRRNGLRTCMYAGATLAFSQPRGRLESWK